MTRAVKCGRHVAPVVRVAGRVHRQDHVAHHGQLLGVEVLEHHAARGGREEQRVAGDVHHVGVAQHGPVAGAVGHGLPVDGLARRRRWANASCGGPVDVAVRVVQVDPGPIGTIDSGGHVVPLGRSGSGVGPDCIPTALCRSRHGSLGAVGHVDPPRTFGGMSWPRTERACAGGQIPEMTTSPRSTATCAGSSAACSLTAAAIHFGFAPSHLSEDWAHGWFFLLIGWLGVAFARPRSWCGPAGGCGPAACCSTSASSSPGRCRARRACPSARPRCARRRSARPTCCAPCSRACVVVGAAASPCSPQAARALGARARRSSRASPA